MDTGEEARLSDNPTTIKQFDVKFVPNGQGKARCKPDPAYPRGITVDAAGSSPACEVSLPYPAPECGWFSIQCMRCAVKIMATAAGRPDDPIMIRISCRMKVAAN
jgi:hypothetical protein